MSDEPCKFFVYTGSTLMAKDRTKLDIHMSAFSQKVLKMSLTIKLLEVNAISPRGQYYKVSSAKWLIKIMIYCWYKYTQWYQCISADSRPVAQIPKCISPISQNASFYNRNMCKYLWKIVHWEIFLCCISGAVRWLCWIAMHAESRQKIAWKAMMYYPLYYYCHVKIMRLH